MRLAILCASLLLGLGCSGDAPNEPTKSAPAAATDHDHGEHGHGDAKAKMDHAEPPADGEAWTCPMHPEVRMHEAGQCPKCKMNLQKEGAAGAAPDGEMAYYCPMHPEVRSHEEGRCGECNMFLVKKGDEASHGMEKPAPKAGDGGHEHGG